MEAIIVGVITGSLSLAGVIIANRASQARIEERVDNLTTEVEKHNNVVERMYALEARVEEQNKTLFTRYNEVHQATQDIAVTARHAQERADAAHNRLDRAGIQGGIS